MPVDLSHFRFECFECALASAFFPRFFSLTHKWQREKRAQRFSCVRVLEVNRTRCGDVVFVGGVNSSSNRRPLMEGREGSVNKGRAAEGP